MWTRHNRITEALNSARRIGILEAYRIRTKLELMPTKRVDIFRLIVNEGIWLRFARLGRLYGAYQRTSGGIGILINSQHPLHLQRLTAAHEFGHHVLNHSVSLDEEEAIDGKPSDDLREQEAFAFASALMIPLDGVHARLPASWRPGQRWMPSPAELYSMSADFGVSYRALVVQLAALEIISWRQAEAFKTLSPLQIKRDLGGGWEPANTRLTVWRFGPNDNGRHITVDLGDELHLYLPAGTTPGDHWKLVDAGHQLDSLEILDDCLLSSQSIVAEDYQHIVLRAVTAAAEVPLVFNREGVLFPETFSLGLTVLPDDRPKEEGFHCLQQERLIAAMCR